MLRRSWSALWPLMSLSPMWIETDVGSMSQLIIFSEVVLPQPDGPTNMTISPAGMTRLSPSTAALCWPAYLLVTLSSRISAPLISPVEPSLCVSVAVMSDPDSLRDGGATQEQEQEVEDQGDDHDAD